MNVQNPEESTSSDTEGLYFSVSQRQGPFQNKQEDRVSNFELYNLRIVGNQVFGARLKNRHVFSKFYDEFLLISISFYSSPIRKKHQDLIKDHSTASSMDIRDPMQPISARKNSKKSCKHSKTNNTTKLSLKSWNKVSFYEIFNHWAKFKFIDFCNC